LLQFAQETPESDRCRERAHCEETVPRRS
jgi:hypothetical protein